MNLSALPSPARRAGLAAIVLGALAALGAVRLAAYPPLPSYTIYGLVRDQVGTALNVDGAEIVLLRDNVEIGRTPISREVGANGNYELAISIDQNRAGSRTYAHNAVAAQGVFSLLVEMNGAKFYPIEVSGTLRAGQGGERVRLDLNLGADTDGDGLPDAWEEWQLYQAGKLPGPGGWDLSLITRDGDFDGDGVSNYAEYVAGTFAGDATERFELRIREKTAAGVQFEFFAITGKVYSIEESTDLRTWTAVPFTTVAGGATARSHRATSVAILPAYVASPTATSRFYRLSVR